MNDGRGNITTYAYDELNRLKDVGNAKNEHTVYTYDNNGNMKTMTDGRGSVRSYDYNAANKLMTEHDPDIFVNGVVVIGKVQNYTYFADGRCNQRRIEIMSSRVMRMTSREDSRARGLGMCHIVCI